MLYLGIGASGLGYLFWCGALERVETSRVAAFLYLEPLVTLVAAMALLHEPVGLGDAGRRARWCSPAWRWCSARRREPALD